MNGSSHVLKRFRLICKVFGAEKHTHTQVQWQRLSPSTDIPYYPYYKLHVCSYYRRKVIVATQLGVGRYIGAR